MRAAARSLLASLDGEQRKLAARPFADDAARRWLEYRPRSRPGACLAELSGTLLPGSPAEFRKLIENDTQKWAKVIEFAGITLE